MFHRLLSVLTVAVLAVSVVAAEETNKKATLTIEGMTCGGCVAAVKMKLKNVERVSAYQVSLEKGEAEVTFDPSKTNAEKIAEAVSETGFKATVKDEKKSKS